MSKRDQKYLDALLDLAQVHEGAANAKVVAAVVYKGAIYLGYNTAKSHPFALQYAKNPEAIYPHAEVNAIRHALKYLSNAELRRSTLYIARAKRPHPQGGQYISGLAAPCSGCQKCISDFEIKRVVYTKDAA